MAAENDPLQGMTPEELAVELGVSEETAKQLGDQMLGDAFIDGKFTPSDPTEDKQS